MSPVTSHTYYWNISHILSVTSHAYYWNISHILPVTSHIYYWNISHILPVTSHTYYWNISQLLHMHRPEEVGDRLSVTKRYTRYSCEIHWPWLNVKLEIDGAL